MSIQDWTRVDAGIFHAFHLQWIGVISRALKDLQRNLARRLHRSLAQAVEVRRLRWRRCDGGFNRAISGWGCFTGTAAVSYAGGVGFRAAGRDVSISVGDLPTYWREVVTAGWEPMGQRAWNLGLELLGYHSLDETALTVRAGVGERGVELASRLRFRPLR